MHHKAKDAFERLCALAARQDGFFTAGQAVEAGYQRPLHSYHVRNGDWKREGWGLYRLAFFPPPEHGRLAVGWWWTRGRRGLPVGVVSHRTALELLGVVEPDGDDVHLTVPPGFRRNSRPPGGVILHVGRVSEDEIVQVGCYRVTRAERALKDMEGAEDVLLRGAEGALHRESGSIEGEDSEAYGRMTYHVEQPEERGGEGGYDAVIEAGMD